MNVSKNYINLILKKFNRFLQFAKRATSKADAGSFELPARANASNKFNSRPNAIANAK